MFSSKEAIFEVGDVPPEWVFEYYLGLSEKLNGQSVKIKSLFNPTENTPSMYIYLNPSVKQYRFKCFSTGNHGEAINLVMTIRSLTYSQAANMIISDYKNYIKGKTYVKTVFKEPIKWKLSDISYRSWNVDDKKYWSQYNIGSNLLGEYNVRAISSFSMSREDESFSRSGRRVYAYTKQDGEVYKIYMPENKDKKFMNFSKYIQGWEQLEGNPRLFICSSLKDIMAIKSLKIQGDFIAPSSENTSIESIINWIQQEYEKKYVIFDNDEAGKKMMERYKEDYNLPYLIVDLSKDISDSIRDHGAKKVKQYLKEHL